MARGTSSYTTPSPVPLDLAEYLTRTLHLQLPESYQRVDAKKHLATITQSIYLDFLLNAGVLQHRPIPRRGEAITLSLWESCPTSALALSPKVSMLLESLQEAMKNPGKACTIPPPEPDNGEAFLYHSMYRLLHQDPTISRWVSALRRSSPLTRLLYFPVMPQRGVALTDGQYGIPSLTPSELDALIEHPALPYLLGLLADHWADVPWPQAEKHFEAQLDRLNARRATLQCFMKRCANKEKLSILIVYPLMYLRLLRRGFVQQVLQVRQIREWKLSLKEQLISAYCGLLELGKQLDQIVMEQVIEPGAYGWNRPEEVRVFMQTYGKQWTSHGLSQQVQEIQLQLRGHLG